MQLQTYFDLETAPQGVTIPSLYDLPSDLYYVFIINQTSHELKTTSYPYVLTYRDTNSTFDTFMNNYISDTFGEKDKEMKYYFVLGDDKKLTHDMTVKDLLKMIGRTKTDGIFLYARSIRKNQENSQYINESAFVNYIQQNNYTKDTDFELKFATRYEHSQIQEISYVPCKFSENAANVQQLYLNNFSKQFALADLNQGSILQIYFCDATGKKTELDLNITFDQQKVYTTTTINVILKNPNKLKLKRVISKQHDCQIIIYKENESEPIRVNYDEISHLTFEDFYTSRLELADSKNKREAIYCLKVMDIIIRPMQRMNAIENLLKGKAMKAMKLVANVVNEKMIFYETIPKLTEAAGTDFKIDEIVIPQDQKFIRDQCRDQSKMRAEKAKNNHFKKSENIEPIMVYTAELMYLQGNKAEVIYVSLNKYLRQSKFIEIDEEAIKSYKKQWKLRYASSLLRHLQVANQLEKKYTEMVTWRGISYDPKIKKEDTGKIITFKQFTSTSINRDIAVDFAVRNSVGPKPLHLLRLIVKTGTPIVDYSIFKRQAEILLNPFTEFVIRDVQEQKIQINRFNVYYLQEIITSKDFPKGKENLIIWIDDKLEEGKDIYDSIKMPTSTTVMHQIASTTQLETWLQKNRHLFDDSSLNLVFITNMTRKEGNNWNGLAGIEGLKKIRQVNAKVPVFFYIGDFEAAKKKVDESKVDQTNIKISSIVSDIKAYFKQVLNLKEL